MALVGWIFWGGLLVLIVFGFWMDKKFRSKAPEKSTNQELHEATILNTHNNYGNGDGFGSS